MVKVKKGPYWRATHPDRDPYEEFDKRKISMALLRAGVRGRHVDEIAEMINPVEGMSTDDIAKIVVKELEKRDPETAKAWIIVREYRRSRFRK